MRDAEAIVEQTAAAFASAEHPGREDLLNRHCCTCAEVSDAFAGKPFPETTLRPLLEGRETALLTAADEGLRRQPVCLVFTLLMIAAWVGFAPSAAAPRAQGLADPPVVGLDHIPVAVRDLEAAAAAYRRLGFALKPGRPHENGVRNQHVKFADGTEIEIITAADARDALTAEYREHLSRGDGAAFVSLFAPDLNRVARAFDAERRPYRRGDGLLTFPLGDPLRYLFFGGRTRSPTDRPEHFQHPNGAEALIGVWIAADRLAAERALLAGLGAIIREQDVQVPEPTPGAVARFPLGEVVLLPGRRQLVQGRRIVGATIRVSSLPTLRRALTLGHVEAPPAVETTSGWSVFLAPNFAHGVWLEFREAS